MTEHNGSTKVGVLGAGTMGGGIATVMLRAGHHTVVREPTDERLVAGMAGVRRFFDGSVDRGKLSAAERDAAVSRLAGTTNLAGLTDCDVVVEAVFEDVDLKADLFRRLDAICKPETLFHTNTSTLSVTAIAAGSSRPERVIGTHYCNPAPLMRLVEVVRARQTGDEQYRRTMDFVASLGKTAVTVQDSPGFIVNRFLIPFENDCVRALAAGLGTVESIDSAVTLGLGYPMGTFQLLDIVGLDIHHAVATSLYQQLHDPRFAPPPLVDQMLAAGHLGRKAGRGFYTYDQAGAFGT